MGNRVGGLGFQDAGRFVHAVFHRKLLEQSGGNERRTHIPPPSIRSHHVRFGSVSGPPGNPISAMETEIVGEPGSAH